VEFVPQKPSWFATSSMDREERKREREERRKGLLCLSMTIAVADGHLIESIDWFLRFF